MIALLFLISAGQTADVAGPCAVRGLLARPPLLRTLRQGSPDGFDEALAEFHPLVDRWAAAQLSDMGDALFH